MDSAGLYQPFAEEDKIEKEIPMISITSNDISRQDIELDEPASKRIDWSKGTVYIRTLSFYHMLPALPNRLKPVYGPFRQSIIHQALNFCADLPGWNRMFQS